MGTKPNIDSLVGNVTQGIARQYFRDLDAYLEDISSTSTGNNKQIFATSGTFIVPVGVTRIYASGCAGGGGGSSFFGCGGGGGESVLLYPIDVTPGESISITIGSGGMGSTNAQLSVSPSGDYSGGEGTATKVGSYLTLNGGYGAKCVAFTYSYVGAKGGPNATSGHYLTTSIYMSASLVYYTGGAGGHSLFGSGGNGGWWSALTDGTYVAGGDGIGFGSGGGGGATKQGSSYGFTKGGNGTSGYVEISW